MTVPLSPYPNRSIIPRASLALARSLACLSAAFSTAYATDLQVTAESQLHRSLDLLRSGQLDAAIAELDNLVGRFPNFRLAHWVRGDMLLARAGKKPRIGEVASSSEPLRDLQAELQARVRNRVEPPPAGIVPRYLLRLEVRKQAIVVDAERFRSYLYENTDGTPRLVRDYYSTIGKQGAAKEREGDKRTPVGVYHVTSRISGARLPDFYGWGAFPIDYPNEWDRRVGRSGNGIWIHGVPSYTYARAPLASDGCVALANPELEELAAWIEPGSTPIVITDKLEWSSPEDLRVEAELFDRQLEAWRKDWQSRDTERYLAHYATSFRSDGMDLGAWSAYKRRVGGGKHWVTVDISSVSVLRSPGREAVVVATFDQHYRSNNRDQKARKRQYWVIEDGRWKIAYEARLRGGSRTLPDSFYARK